MRKLIPFLLSIFCLLIFSGCFFSKNKESGDSENILPATDSIWQQSGNTVFDSLLKSGDAYFEKEWYQTALHYFIDALTICEENDYEEKSGYLYYMISLAYKNMYEFENAIEYSEKAVKLLDTDPYVFINLAEIYEHIDQYEKARDCYEQALHLSKHQNNIQQTGIIYYHLGNNALSFFDLESAEKYAHTALIMNRENGNSKYYVACLILFSKLEELHGHYNKSEEYIREALQIAIEHDFQTIKKICYMILAELSIAQRKQSESMIYWKEFEHIDCEITSEILHRVALEHETNFETAKKEYEIEKQQHIIEKQNAQRCFFEIGIAVCLVLIVLMWCLLRLRTRHNRVLVETNAVKDKFFNIISHDLKNPAIMQKNAIEQIVDNIFVWDVKTLSIFCRKLLKSAEMQVELLYNLLNWAQMQTGKMPFIPSTFDLIHSLRSEIHLINLIATNKEITFQSQIPEEAMVTADCNMIITVVRNLLTNAVKFTHKGGCVTLEIIPNQIPPVTYRISVTDTGIGMTEEQIQNLFNLETVHSNMGTANETGSGLGLIVCKELLEKHGSRLHIESEINKGSRFWFVVDSEVRN